MALTSSSHSPRSISQLHHRLYIVSFLDVSSLLALRVTLPRPENSLFKMYPTNNYLVDFIVAAPKLCAENAPTHRPKSKLAAERSSRSLPQPQQQ